MGPGRKNLQNLMGPQTQVQTHTRFSTLNQPVVSCLRVPYCVVRPAWPVLEEFARLQMITRRALAQGLNVEIPRADLPALPALLRALQARPDCVRDVGLTAASMEQVFIALHLEEQVWPLSL